MGPWLADTIRQCDGLVNMLSYWTFSDVFEEQGVVRQPFYGGYGLLAERGLPKPAFEAFRLLHHLGDQRLDTNSGSALVTRDSAGKIAIAVWNLALPEEQGQPKTVTLAFKGWKGQTDAQLSRVDATHGSLMQAYEAMGKPVYPSSAQIAALRRAGNLPRPETKRIVNGTIDITLPPHGLALIELPAPAISQGRAADPAPAPAQRTASPSATARK